MSISFDSIPGDMRTPGQYTEFNSSRAVQGTSTQPHKALAIGQLKTTHDGTATVEVPYPVSSPDQAETLFGVGSQISQMCRAFKNANPYTELWAIGLGDHASGDAAAATITVTGSATEDGTVHAYIGGHHLAVSVSNGDAFGDVAAAIDAASDADPRIPAIGVAALGVVTFTSRWKGLNCNDIDIRVNYQEGQKTPAGLTVTPAAAFASGDNETDYSDAIAAMADTQFNTIVVGTNDATELGKITSELDDRWGPLEQKEGHCFTFKPGTQAQLTTYGNTLNSKHLSAMGAKDIPTTSWECASILGAVDAYQCQVDVSRPRQTLELKGILPPPLSSQFTRAERQILLTDGIATLKTSNAGISSIERLITTYQTNPASVLDTSYLDITTPRTLGYLRYDLNARIALKYPRHKLVANANLVGEGAAVVDPGIIRSEILAWFLDQAKVPHVEDLDQFNEELVVEINASDPSRIDYLAPMNLVNGARVFAGQIQFLI